MYQFIVSNKLLSLAVKLKNDKTSNVRVRCVQFLNAVPPDLLSKSKEATAALKELGDDEVVQNTLREVTIYPCVSEKKEGVEGDKEGEGEGEENGGEEGEGGVDEDKKEGGEKEGKIDGEDVDSGGGGDEGNPHI